jgi:threonyl-tRNA synthetase
MPAITLPDGSERRFDTPVTGTDVAAAIGPGLARAALAMKLDGKTVDLATPIEQDAAIVFHHPARPRGAGNDPPRRHQ